MPESEEISDAIRMRLDPIDPNAAGWIVVES